MKVFDLAQPMRKGMPQSPNHPAYTHSLVRRHGDMVRAGGGSAANDILVMGTHVGTHVDALAHVSQDGLLHGGVVAADVQSDAGFARLGIDEFPPFVGRGVLLDVARVHGVEVLPPGYEVTAEDLSAACGDLTVNPGDAVLIGTGWSRHFQDGQTFLGTRDGVPGPGVDAARWLAEREIAVTGAETIAYEHIAPGAGHASLPVHRILLVEAGINIVETMLLSELADAGVAEFQFILAPLKLVGATGSPVRPLAVVPA
ncbi:cyclase [Actinoplanes lobatus]|uniref:Cyclase n=1 Tax=Actinoplanes lobatus TaxID=113568 RepID=A0A7W7MHC6_9ACTN|nr:cyclase family protein [Actinoplanes lobatus]MBB4750334.1 kynurenine formamidase [Actinoplanes lobatus]GGN71431.1 cyclase [Actinoplanes lobatus]GIE41872.1 cyclase [Actinoplanes lobatus]